MSGNLLKSLATVSGLTMFSRVLGFVRQILIAGVIGAGGNPVADAFWAAFRLPNMFRRLFAEGAFHAAFIPLFQGALTKGGEEDAKRFAEETLAGLLFVLILLTALVEIAAPLFVYLIASGFGSDPEKFSMTTLYTRIMFPYLACMSVVGLLSGVLNSMGRFAATAGAPLALNVCMIVAILLFADAEAETAGGALAVSVMAAGVLQLLWLLFGAMRQGYAPRLVRPRLTPGVKRLLALGAPGFVSAGAIQINLIIGTNIASRQDGAVSWLMNADQLYQLPLAIFGIALGIVLLPLLSRRLKEGDEKGAAATINQSLEFSALLAFPAATAFIIMGEPICDALYRGLAADALALFGGRGSAFTAEDAAKTGAALALFGWGLPAFVWHKVFSPAFFAREDTRSPMNYALISIAANTVLALALFPFFGFLAVAFATSAASWIQVALLGSKLYRVGQFRPSRRLTSRFCRILAANVGLAGVLWFALQHTDRMAGWLFDRQWLAVVAIVVAGVLAYGAIALAVGAARLSDYKPSGASGEEQS
jgi:putative peptidoglycan lipid II flippase